MVFRARFLPKHPEKYEGEVDKIFARSSWEASVMKFFDGSRDIIRWGSEINVIPYLSPLDSRVHEYWPDFWVELRKKDGSIVREIVEVKPRHESEEKYAKNDRSKNALLVNNAKWAAAHLYCESRGMKFRVITEHSIYWQGEKKKKEVTHA
jgi:hypothetical protein